MFTNGQQNAKHSGEPHHSDLKNTKHFTEKMQGKNTGTYKAHSSTIKWKSEPQKRDN